MNNVTLSNGVRYFDTNYPDVSKYLPIEIKNKIVRILKREVNKHCIEALNTAAQNAYIEFIKDDMPFDCMDILEQEKVTVQVNKDSIVYAFNEF